MEVRSERMFKKYDFILKFFHSFKMHQLLHVVTGKCLEMSKDGAKLMMRFVFSVF